MLYKCILDVVSLLMVWVTFALMGGNYIILTASISDTFGNPLSPVECSFLVLVCVKLMKVVRFTMAAHRVNMLYSTRETVELVLNEGSDLEDFSDSGSEENTVDSGKESVPVDLASSDSDDDTANQRYNVDTDVDNDQSDDLLAPLPQPQSPSPPPNQVMYDDDSEWMYEWTQNLNNFPLATPFSGTHGLSLPDVFDAVTPTPLHFYRRFTTDQVSRSFKAETNRYAVKACADKAAAGNLSRRSIFRTWKPVSTEEMTQFLSILIHMGLVKKLQITDYWSKHPALLLLFSLLLSVHGRVQEGLVLINFMVQHGPGLFRWDMTQYGTSWEDLDFFSHNSRRVVVDLNEMWSTQHWQLFNVTVIMKVGQHFLEKGHHLFFDNYFLSIKLAQDLEEKGTYVTLTIHSNRKGWPKDFSSAMMKKMKVGNVHFRQDGNLVSTIMKCKYHWYIGSIFKHFLKENKFIAAAR